MEIKKTSWYAFLLVSIILIGCSKNEDPIATPPQPVKITNFTPLNAITGATVVITGENFSTVAANNIVKFNGETAVVSNASATSLSVIVPLHGTSGKITAEANGTIDSSDQSFTKNIIMTTFVGTYATPGLVDATGAAARFKYPLGMTVDNAGNVFVADVDNHCIRKITQTGIVTTFAGNGTAGHVDANGTSARFSSPYDLAFDSQGNLFVSESYGHKIRKITPAGDVTTFAGNGVAGYVNDVGTAARFNFPWGIDVDANDNLYVCDRSNNRIRKITPAGVVSSFAGNGLGPTNGGDMVTPRGIALDAAGNLYVVGNPFTSQPILKVSPTGVIDNRFAQSVNGEGHVNGPLAESKFNGPTSISMDAYGNLYLTEYGNNNLQNIRKISANLMVSTITSTYTTPALGVVADKFGHIFVSKTTGAVVLKIDL